MGLHDFHVLGDVLFTVRAKDLLEDNLGLCHLGIEFLRRHLVLQESEIRISSLLFLDLSYELSSFGCFGDVKLLFKDSQVSGLFFVLLH